MSLIGQEGLLGPFFPLGLAQVLPVSGTITSPSEPMGIDKGFHEERLDLVNLEAWPRAGCPFTAIGGILISCRAHAVWVKLSRLVKPSNVRWTVVA